MKKFLLLSALLALTLSNTGCAIFGGYGPLGHSTTVTLSKNNFTVIKTNVKGTAKVMVLFPTSLPVLGVKMGIPLGNTNLYKQAMEELRQQLPKKENVGLVNVTVDTKLTSYIFFGYHSLTITADVVQFHSAD